MGKWLARVIGKEKPQEKSYQNPSKNDTDKTDKISHLNLFDPKIKNQPRLDLLTEVELEAFNGWYATARKPKFSTSHPAVNARARRPDGPDRKTVLPCKHRWARPSALLYHEQSGFPG